MKTIYLKNGQEAELIKDLGTDGYLVDPMYIYYQEDDEFTQSSGNRIIVNEIFDKPPIEKINQEYTELTKKVTDTTKQLYDLKYEVKNLINQKSKFDRFIINREDILTAKRLVVFEEHKIMPIDVKKELKGNIKLSLEIRMTDGDTKVWGYRCYEENRYDSGNFIDPKYGIITDISDEDLLELTKKRLREMKLESINEYYLKAADDEVLTEEAKAKKYKLLKYDKEKKIADLQKQIQNAQESLDSILGKDGNVNY